MKINGNFDQRVVVHASEMPWAPSPIHGVDRRALDRVGDEVARATSIVKYAPESQFPSHHHTGGEEFLVLDGIFQDEHGSFPAGSYVRNPPTSFHTPSSKSGCVIFVKLWQFDLQDRAHIRLRSDLMEAIPNGDLSGVSTIPLYKDQFETVSIQHWQPNVQASFAIPEGAEVLVLDGEWFENGEKLTQHSWLRLPTNCMLTGKSGSQGAKLWIKMGHLKYIERDINNLNQLG
jgi:anti-sigma factor ChrR (cupin superfamily)